MKTISQKRSQQLDRLKRSLRQKMFEYSDEKGMQAGRIIDKIKHAQGIRTLSVIGYDIQKIRMETYNPKTGKRSVRIIDNPVEIYG